MSSLSEAQIRDEIREVLKGADLSAMSSKLVRKKLEEKFETDLSTRKQEIDDILMSLINAMSEEDDAKPAVEVKQEFDCDNESDQEHNAIHKAVKREFLRAHQSGYEEDNSNSKSEPLSVLSLERTIAKPKSKRSLSPVSTNDSDADAPEYKPEVSKKPRVLDAQLRGEPSTSDDDVDDESYARKLQQQESRTRPRSSKQKTEKKSKQAKSTPSDGSSRRKGNSLYSQECVLSPELTDVMGTDRSARKDVVSQMWKIFKERDLLDPKNKQYVICDDQLEKIFKCKRFKAFSMMKILKTHIKDAKDVL